MTRLLLYVVFCGVMSAINAAFFLVNPTPLSAIAAVVSALSCAFGLGYLIAEREWR